MLMYDEDEKRTYFGATCNVGIGSPGGELHVEWGSTFTRESLQFNVFDAAGRFYTKIMEW